jgi:hypothetical protein
LAGARSRGAPGLIRPEKVCSSSLRRVSTHVHLQLAWSTVQQQAPRRCAIAGRSALCRARPSHVGSTPAQATGPSASRAPHPGRNAGAAASGGPTRVSVNARSQLPAARSLRGRRAWRMTKRALAAAVDARVVRRALGEVLARSAAFRAIPVKHAFGIRRAPDGGRA